MAPIRTIGTGVYLTLSTRSSLVLLIAAASSILVVGLAGCGAFRQAHHDPAWNEPSTASTAMTTPPSTTDGYAATTGGWADRGSTHDGTSASLTVDGIDLTTGHPLAADSTDGSNPSRPAADHSLNLFGEIDGKGGSAKQFAAWENIAQVSFAPEGADFDPAVDGTGRAIVYASTQHNEAADIYLKNVDGTTVVQLTRDPADEVMPSFSPDNSQIAFASNRAGNWDIFVMSATGGAAVQITTDSAHEVHPSWSPDGRWLVFCRLGDQSGRWEMWMTEVANPATRRFIEYGLFPEWCPDPAVNRIVYQRARERGSRLFSIWTVELVDGEARNMTEIAGAANAALINPTWSRDGRMIAFATIVNPDGTRSAEGTPTSGPPSTADIWVIDFDGTNKVRLTNGEFANLQPAWGADGRVYFVSNRSGVDNIWALGPDRAIEVAHGGANRDGIVKPGDQMMNQHNNPLMETAGVPTSDEAGDGGIDHHDIDHPQP